MAKRARSASIPAEASDIPAYACCCCCSCCCCRIAKICCSRALPARTSAPIICRFAAGSSSWGCCLDAAFLGAARLAAFGARASPSPSPSVAGRLPFGGGVSVTCFLQVAASAAAVVPMAGTGAFNQAARSSQCWRCILASKKARRQLPQVRMLNHFSFFFSFAEADRTAAQPAPSFSEAPARMSSHTRRPFGMNSPRRTPGCSGSGC
mmetsp:Transcript_41109/g.117522  ORF Transcript_41109/g.117522 Transcript_41109/m.117522 type:complete len:208 (-) Transcript_41109:297-920(-)